MDMGMYGNNADACESDGSASTFSVQFCSIAKTADNFPLLISMHYKNGFEVLLVCIIGTLH